MADLPTIAGGPSVVGSDPTASRGVVLTAHASADTKASTWTELIASTTYAATWLLVTIRQVAGGGGLSHHVDIGVGASTAEVVLIPNLFTYSALANKQEAREFLFPLRVPAGTRISARCAASTGSATVAVTVHAIASPISAPPGLSRVEALGALTGGTAATSLTDPGATPHTDGATWTTMIAATSFAYRWLCVSVGNVLDTTFAADVTHLLDIGVGAAASEVEVIGDLFCGGNTLNDATMMSWSFPVAIPAGVRVSARHRASVGTAGDRRLQAVLYGVG